jgi:branched-subunit amino acid transport protein
MIRLNILLIILGTAAATLVPRILPLVMLSRMNLSGRVLRWLGCVPVAVLAGLLAQSIVCPDGTISLPPDNLALVAVVPVLGIAALTRSLMGTVAAGVVIMALLRAVTG